MRLPYFSVGEEVILCSRSYPEKNGEYIIESCFEGVEPYGDIFKDTFVYTLVNCEPRVGYAGWGESALRKKHKPSDNSFQELLIKCREKESA